ncbi:TonB-dependent receptor domain-containing protein [Neptunitalea lumnitzerae]|uniref:SusC/RagA family TonB-linked outer membrane protein n=1 Tax=Neptunitalea lumnitzerae TaxID=2965509 RepID=A0ABQ5MJP0_9FLAO|nr:TonB-dependent receptor [Neptunitalea sp. Y10]GLB49635.1 SusC/RagA family TonB-linked outer membrane protein [Neptunitalea sp. Y10]
MKNKITLLKKGSIYTLIACLFINISFASEGYLKQQELKSILTILQGKYRDVDFVYNPKTFDGIIVSNFEFKEGEKLESNLKNLEKVAPISYMIDGNTVALRKKNTTTFQQSSIQGFIYDEVHVPIWGATIVVRGSSNGVVTDESGGFTITPETYPTTLQVSFLGYKSKEITISEPTEMLEITLDPNMESLNEVVVTGQGADVRKKRLPTKVTSIKGEDLEKISAQRIDQQLAAQLPNAQINFTGGQAGATSIIRARGVNSAMLSSTPIIYLDGVRLDNLNTQAQLGGSASGASMSALADIPMDNIAKIEYINGGAATTLYGSDAANGVIQIFTKKGGKAGTHLSVIAEGGVETPTTDYLHFDRTKDLLFRTGEYQKYTLNLNGSTDNDFGYNFSGSFQNSSGVQIHDQNASLKANIGTGFKAKLIDGLNYESSFNYVYNKYKRNRNGNQGGYTGLWFAEDGASSITGPGFNNRLDELTDEEFAEIKAFVDNAERLQDNQIVVNRFTTSQVFKYQPIDNLVFRFTGGLDFRNQEQINIQTNEYLSATRGQDIIDQGSIQNIQRTYLGITLELNGQYTYNTDDFSFITTLGGQFFRNRDHQVLYSGTNIRDGALSISDAAVKSADEYLVEVLNYGIYLQENIGFKDKLFLDLGVRGDRNPSFGEDIGTQYYPKAGLSYLLSSEPWFTSELVNSLRLRGSYGLAGNLPPAWAQDRTIDFTGYLGDQAAFFGNLGNDNLKPEKTTTVEGGFDVTLFNNRFNFSAGYYRSLTKDALFNVPLAPSYGYDGSQLYNIGEIENYGFELSAQVIAIQTQDLTLSFNASFNTLHNEVLDSNGAPAFNINGFSARTLQTVVQEGYPIGFIRGGYGIFDENGVLESTVAQSYLGSTIPKTFGNLGFNLDYKNFNLFATGSYQTGAYGANWDAQFRYYYGASDDYIPAGEIEANGRSNWLAFTNRFVEKTDFLKIRTIGLSYNLKSKNSGFYDNMLFSFTAVNPFNFVSSSFDPEATISGAAQGQGGASTGGISYATYSMPRQFLLGVKINL